MTSPLNTPDVPADEGAVGVASVVAPRHRWLVPAVTAAAGLIVGAVMGAGIASAVIAADAQAQVDAAAAAAADAKSTLFADAAKKCGAGSAVEIADDDHTLIVDGEGEDFGTGDVSFTQLDCLIDALGAPTADKRRMYETRSLDGRQEASWGELSVSWSYHPDDGLDLIFELDTDD